MTCTPHRLEDIKWWGEGSESGFGPQLMCSVTDSKFGLLGYVVIDSTIDGHCCGGQVTSLSVAGVCSGATVEGVAQLEEQLEEMRSNRANMINNLSFIYEVLYNAAKANG